jgi:hypothetical protein
MTRQSLAALCAIALFAPLTLAQDGIQRGRIKEVNVDQLTVTLTVGEQERKFGVSDKIQLFEAPGKNLRERLESFKPGTPVFFKVEGRDGKQVLVGLRHVDAAQGRKQPKVDTSKLKPLTDMGDEKYHGHAGGLYPGGANQRPAVHEQAGLALAKQVRPLGRDGKPAVDGKIVLMSVGMSNTSQASQGFQKQLAGQTDINPSVVFVNGAQGGMTAAAIQDPNDNRTGAKYWSVVDERLKSAGVTREQVQVIWIKQADAGPTQGFPAYAEKLRDELRRIVRLLPTRFPNVKLVYLSSRTYGGFATTPLNPEPYAFESGFSVRWLIEEQLKDDPALNYDAAKGAVRAPWLSWGPYLWAQGATRRGDGFYYEESDFAGDGTHHAPAGQTKLGQALLQFFKSDTTTRSWFVAR